MVDILGHLGMALLWSTPAWLLWGRRGSVAFAGVVLLTALLPDVDLYLRGVPHHGPTHSIAFVGAVALVAGALITVIAVAAIRRVWWLQETEFPSAASLYVFFTSGLFVGGMSHVFTDMLSTSSFERPVNPFWPLFEKPFSVYVIHEFSAPIWNGGLLLVAFLIHAVLFVFGGIPVSRFSSS